MKLNIPHDPAWNSLCDKAVNVIFEFMHSCHTNGSDMQAMWAALPCYIAERCLEQKDPKGALDEVKAALDHYFASGLT